MDKPDLPQIEFVESDVQMGLYRINGQHSAATVLQLAASFSQRDFEGAWNVVVSLFPSYGEVRIFGVRRPEPLPPAGTAGAYRGDGS